MSLYQLDYLDKLESEAIHIMREVAGQFERPALLFSGGKDSICLVWLALKAFRPGEDFRAGRWWWEDADKKECGLHVHQ